MFVPAKETHAATEALLRASGIPFVSLRNGFYAESALFQLGGVRQLGKISLPDDGPVSSWTARADLAQAAVAALTEPALFEGISPPLTGSQTLDFAAIATVASQILGRHIERDTVSDEQYRTSLVSRGLPEAMADAFGTLYTAARSQEFAVVHPALQHLLGRKPTSMEDILRNFLSHPERKPAQHG